MALLLLRDDVDPSSANDTTTTTNRVPDRGKYQPVEDLMIYGGGGEWPFFRCCFASRSKFFVEEGMKFQRHPTSSPAFSNINSHRRRPIPAFLCVAAAVFLVGIVVFLHDWHVVNGNTAKNSSPNEIEFRPLSPGEFFKPVAQQPSSRELEEFFRYNDKDVPKHTTQLFSAWKSAWQCHDDTTTNTKTRRRRPRRPPIVFLHLPRSGGSAVRMLLRAYTTYCAVSMAVVVNCLDVGYSWILKNRTTWVNAVGSAAEGSKCVLEFLRQNNNNETSGIRLPSTVTWKELKGVEVLLGQIPLGLPGDAVFDQAVYWTVIRDPLEQWVSRLIFYEELEDVEPMMEVLRKALFTTEEQHTAPYYFPSSSVFITPYQKEWMHSRSVPWTPERRLSLCLQNLQKYPFVVGVAERWSETLFLLRSVMDSADQVPGLFRQLENMVLDHEISNLTASLVQMIRRDPTLLAAAQHHLRFEQQLYDYAYRLHEKQYNWLKDETVGTGGH